eukprot:NODE_105_length_19900_cov_0.306550.p3 type:complete len:483 gc:universal NODE_105_length_19900_cov_0.306550:13495-14943(+)
MWELFVGIVYIIICPFTKVEESFNMHGIYDIVNGSIIWDHEIYPGPIHRTFIGNAIIGIFGYIPCNILKILYQGPYIGIIQQTLIRIMLYLINVMVLEIYSNRLLTYKANFLLITFTQFHLPFYLSRTIPNTFAFPLVLLGLTDWISSLYDSKYTRNAVRLVIYASVIFRCEIGVLLLAILMFEKLQSRPILNYAAIIVYDALVAISITVLIDSWFWDTLTWPELSGFVYNVLFNKSLNWGAQPFYQYGVEIIKICNIALLFLPFAFHNHLAYKLLFLSAFVISVMSILKHKEWRFIMYVIPLINSIAAIGMHRLYSIIGKIVYLVPVCQFLLSLLFVYISSLNYAGGYASISYASQTQIENPYQLWSNAFYDVISPSQYPNSSIYIDFGTKQMGATLFVYPLYEKPDARDAKPPYHVGIRSSELDIDRINESEEILASDYLLTTAKLDHVAEWCIKGYSKISWNCRNLVCVDNKTCLFKIS